MIGVKNKKNGIKLTTPSEEICKKYIDDAYKVLDTLENEIDQWKIIKSYYICYYGIYSLCAKCGIKCEIHSCTIELMGLFGFSQEEKTFILDLQKDREAVQYYLEERKPIDIHSVKSFLISCREKQSLDIEKIRMGLK